MTYCDISRQVSKWKTLRVPTLVSSCSSWKRGKKKYQQSFHALGEEVWGKGWGNGKLLDSILQSNTMPLTTETQRLCPEEMILLVAYQPALFEHKNILKKTNIGNKNIWIKIKEIIGFNLESPIPRDHGNNVQSEPHRFILHLITEEPHLVRPPC